MSLYISQLYLSIWIENLNIFFISFTFAISLSILLAELNLYLTFCRLKRLHLPVPHFRLWVVMAAAVVEAMWKLMKNLRPLRLKKQSELYQIYYHGKFAMCMTMWHRRREEVNEKIALETKWKIISIFSLSELWFPHQPQLSRCHSSSACVGRVM